MGSGLSVWRKGRATGGKVTQMTCKFTKLPSGMSGFCHSWAPPRSELRKSAADCIRPQFAPLSFNTPVHPCPHSARLEACWIANAVTATHRQNKKIAEWKVGGISIVSVRWLTSRPPVLSPPAPHPLQTHRANACACYQEQSQDVKIIATLAQRKANREVRWVHTAR